MLKIEEVVEEGIIKEIKEDINWLTFAGKKSLKDLGGM